jgi:hypothetical protein
LENVYYRHCARGKPMRRILMLCAGVLLASAAAAVSADRNKLPVQFTGDWCIKGDERDKEQTYRFGSCLPTHKGSDTWLTVRVNGFDAHETGCKLIRANADENSKYLVKFRCTAVGETREENYWMSLQLVMTPTDREP